MVEEATAMGAEATAMLVEATAMVAEATAMVGVRCKSRAADDHSGVLSRHTESGPLMTLRSCSCKTPT